VSAACASSFDKEYTGYAFPAAKPETMYGMIGVDSPYSGIKFDEVQVSDSLEGFNKTLDQIARFENGDTNLAKLSSCKYAKLSEEARAKNLAEVLGSWYVIFSNLDDNIATAYNNRSNIGNYNISKIRFLEPIKSFLPVILKECDVPVEYHKYLMGVEPIPTENSGARKYVSEFYKNLRNIAASNPSKFLGLIKGRKFTKD